MGARCRGLLAETPITLIIWEYLSLFVHFTGVMMILVIIASIILLLKIAGIAPVAGLSWLWVLSPWVVILVWWEVITPLIGWDKHEAEKKMQKAEKDAQEHKKKQRGF